jgi:hypothetical protein
MDKDSSESVKHWLQDLGLCRPLDVDIAYPHEGVSSHENIWDDTVRPLQVNGMSVKAIIYEVCSFSQSFVS